MTSANGRKRHEDWWRRRLLWAQRIGPARHFTTRAIARLIGKSQRTVQRYVRQGRLRAIGGSDRTGDHVRVYREDLLDFLASDIDP
jgi:excisionase family DNA binding protein